VSDPVYLLYMADDERPCIELVHLGTREQAVALANRTAARAGVHARLYEARLVHDTSTACAKPKDAPGTAPAPNTVKVRVAVAVDAKGRFQATGYTDGDDEEVGNNALCFLSDATADDIASDHLVWVEADVPLPKVETVSGSVVEPTMEGQ
jgi:hypothetical protein